MPVTQQDLNNFHRFATEQLESGHVGSFDDLFVLWDSMRSRDDVNSEVARGLDDLEAGRYQPAAEAMAEIRDEFGFAAE
mgnify:CR=1 FL=1